MATMNKTRDRPRVERLCSGADYLPGWEEFLAGCRADPQKNKGDAFRVSLGNVLVVVN
jgi:hypothetical protein